MRKYVLMTIFFVVNCFAQEVKDKTYKFINPSVVKDIGLYEKAFSTADMSSFRFEEKSNIIEFDNGLKVEIFSAQKLTIQGFKVDFSKLISSDKFKDNDYIFLISDDGKYILRRFTKTEFKSKSHN